MIEWPLLLMSGVLGSAHCLGMCGPFALTIGSASPSWRSNMIRQSCYSAGRIFTYAVLGAIAAFFGVRLAHALADWTNVSAILAIAAGLLLITQGLLATGILPKRGILGAASCPGAAGLRALLTARGLVDVFLAGMFTGLLPCGLLYGMLALAASTHDMLRGTGTMVVFGLGTVPAMIATGLGGSLLQKTARRHIHAIAAWCLVLTGLASIARGAGFLPLGGARPAGCPFCVPEDEPRTPDIGPIVTQDRGS